ncbi:MAG: cupin domain-containing protein [Chitinophagaceae bacterium]
MKFFLLIYLFANATVLMAQKTDSLPSHVYRWDSVAAKKQKTWTTRAIIEGSTNSLSRFEVTAVTLEPGKASPPPSASYDVEELLIVKDGLLNITIDGVTKKLGAGSVAFAMPRMVHGVSNAGNTKATYYLLKYKGKLPMDIDRAKRAGGSFMLDWNELATTNTDKGYRRDFFNRPTSQLGQFEMHTTALNANEESHAPHTHVQEEIILVLRGNVEMYIDGDRYNASAGDVVFLSSRVPHNLTNTGEGQCEYFAFQWRN